jgi:hypothetical protein
MPVAVNESGQVYLRKKKPADWLVRWLRIAADALRRGCSTSAGWPE